MTTDSARPFGDAGNPPGVEVLSLRGITENEQRPFAHLARAIDDACRSTGFFGIIDHGIPAEMIERALIVSARFFGLPDAAKNRSRAAAHRVLRRGYVPLGGEAQAAAAAGTATAPATSSPPRSAFSSARAPPPPPDIRRSEVLETSAGLTIS